MTERQKSLLVLNGAALLLSSVATGWLHMFQLLGEIDLWPVVQHIDVQVPGQSRAWIMAHLEGITNGLILIATAMASRFLALSARQFTVLVWCSLIFAWMFTLPAIANAWFGTRGLAMGGGPWGPSLANDLIFVSGWPPMIAVHIALPLMLWGAWKHYQSLGES